MKKTFIFSIVWALAALSPVILLAHGPAVSIGVGNGNTPENSAPIHESVATTTVEVYATIEDPDFDLENYHFRVVKVGGVDGYTCLLSDALFAPENQGYASTTLSKDACGFNFNQSVYTSLNFTNSLIATLNVSDLVSYGGEGDYWFIIGAKDTAGNRNASNWLDDPKVMVTLEAVEAATSTSSQDSGNTGGPDSSNSSNGSSGSSSGGGSSRNSGQSLALIVFNEIISNIDGGSGSVSDDGTVVIEWDTNLPATSQVVYGPTLNFPYLLNLNTLPDLGYPFGSVETLEKIIHHRVVLKDLIAGETYVYRIVSRASPATVSSEFTFTMPNEQVVINSGNTNGASNASGSTGATTSASSNEKIIDVIEEAVTEDPSSLLAFSLGGISSFSGWLILVLAVLAILGILWYVARRRNWIS